MKTISFSNAVSIKEYALKHCDQTLILFGKNQLVTTAIELMPENVVLCSTERLVSSTGVSETGFSGLVVASQYTELVPIDEPPILSLASLQQAYQQVAADPNAFLLLLCDGCQAHEEMILTSFYFLDPHFKMIGGSAADENKGQTVISLGNKKIPNLAIFFSLPAKILLIKENLYLPIGKRLLVTKADPLKRVVYTFNGRPAAEEYANQLGISVAELTASFIRHPIGKKRGEDIYINSPQRINDDHSISFYAQIIPNTFVEILTPGKIDQILTKTRQQIGQAELLFSIHCTLRNRYLIQSQQWGKVLASLNQVATQQIGFVSNGEQFNWQHLNQTMVLLAIKENTEMGDD
ncbi:MAG: FIST C-terminal domain-containing protein [Liquorilactobacillus nagelii]|jgi:hypothetical protein|uniref:FIST signal transduction protein n=1 Tax=Liquorilactobacillus nagelii TaxID=82688 RepID=UPI0024325E13|nr:FIST C-terminal domain-containing protein [Liquorilactobacillus nagelii]MCI1633666.1 FIST C-terminal domain-containing protein [Liquorilactobacillus nagelii]MCI1921548.1 FIST C-terminal domain-containing protein [Liquorilactobacillus nagelii]MCI1977038.1 FIST C-terminal domain-containing protein [Liquorilactobacillus nagelii]